MVKIKKSRDYTELANKLMGLGLQEPEPSQRLCEGSMLVSAAKGSEIIDQFNNVYIDYNMADGALILGHAHRNVVLAAKKTAERGIAFSYLSRHEVELAEQIVKRIPSLEIVRFCQNSDEAIKRAISLAREFTKRKIVVSFEGCSFGHVHTDESDDINIKLPFNDINALENLVGKIKGNIACFLVEPVATTMGIVYAEDKFLLALRDLSKKHGIVLIFDEINTAFWGEQASYQQECIVYADITCLGKIIGGGFPLGAYGGKKEIIKCLDYKYKSLKHDVLFQSPVIAKTGLAVLRALDKNSYKGLESKSNKVINKLNEIFEINDINAHASCYKSMVSIYFRKEPVHGLGDFSEASSELEYDRLYGYLKSNGINFPPSFNKPFCISALHSKKDLNKLLNLLEDYFKKY